MCFFILPGLHYMKNKSKLTLQWSYDSKGCYKN